MQHSNKDRYKFFVRVIKGVTDAVERVGMFHLAELAKSESSNRALRVDLEKLRTHLQSLEAAGSGEGIVKEVLEKLDSVERELHLEAADDPWLQHYLKRKRGNSQDILREILRSLNSNDNSKDRLREQLLGEGIDFDEWERQYRQRLFLQKLQVTDTVNKLQSVVGKRSGVSDEGVQTEAEAAAQ